MTTSSENSPGPPRDGERASARSSRFDPGALMGAAEQRFMVQRHLANPGDPVIRRPRLRGAGEGPDYSGTPGRIAIVQGQTYLVGIIMVAQLFLITTALYELLSGRDGLLWWLAGVSLGGFLLALLIALWPRSRVKGY